MNIPTEAAAANHRLFGGFEVRLGIGMKLDAGVVEPL
jgi:hypothetical protein